MSNKIGFTLAEVLITLGIIGVVAAMTIPSLVTRFSNDAYVSQLKKVTSTLDNGFKMLMANKNCTDMTGTGIIDASADNTVDNFANLNVFNVVKTCHVNTSGCYVSSLSWLDNTTVSWDPTAYYSMVVFADGSIIGFNSAYGLTPDCSAYPGINQYSTVCTAGGYNAAFIDVNGKKPPNKFGRDIFRFYISKYGIILPEGSVDDTNAGWPWHDPGNSRRCFDNGAGMGDGQTCFQRIVEQGWQMLY